MSDFWAYVLHIQKKKANTEREGEVDSSYITQKLENNFFKYFRFEAYRTQL